MRVNHCLLYVRMTEYFLQGENIAPVHHKMTGESMPQNMNPLTVWQVRGHLLDHPAQKLIIDILKNAARSPLAKLIKELIAYGHSSVFAVLSVNKHRLRMSKGKRPARAVLTGMCYSVGSMMRQGSSSLTWLTGQSAITSSTWRR